MPCTTPLRTNTIPISTSNQAQRPVQRAMTCEVFYAAATGDRTELGNGKDEEYAWLAEISTPDDLHMRSGKYGGPAFQTW